MAKVSLKMYLVLIFSIFIIIPFIALVFGVLILLPANDPNWMEGWLFIFLFIGLLFLYYLYFLITDPQTILNRSKQTSESKNVVFSSVVLILFLLVMIVPGLERQFSAGSSALPFAIEIFGFIGITVGFFIVFLANRENTYASKGLRIHEGHQVIKTGPYAVIRHPMYAGFFIMFLGMPISLGSVISLLPAILMIIAVFFRIRWEEDQLLNELEGYLEYTKQVRYKLIPKIY
ncbi:MAG: methyltransferase family protein [Candidatus Hodarchaeales archaeon]|jgi:protein-S-isoprenylcysteine O-methyltransferase Ste14